MLLIRMSSISTNITCCTANFSCVSLLEKCETSVKCPLRISGEKENKENVSASAPSGGEKATGEGLWEHLFPYISDIKLFIFLVLGNCGLTPP